MRGKRVRGAGGTRPAGSAGSAARVKRGYVGQAEVVVLLTFAAVIGLAFLWALVLHEKPVADRRPAAVDPTESTLVPPSLPAPRRYAVADTGVNVRQGPATNTAALTRVEAGSRVTVICKTTGQDVSGDSGSTNLWVRLDLGELGVGYASALYVDTGDDIENPNRIGDCALAPTT